MPCTVTDSVKKIAAQLGFPVVIYAVNPFIHEGYRTANNQTALYRAVKSLGMNYKFAVCAQPLKGEMSTIKSFFGKCDDAQTQPIAESVYKLFQIPICQLHIQKIAGKAYLSGLQPIDKAVLDPVDVKKISKEVLLLSMQGDHISG